MELNWFQSLFLGLLSGITEVLPVSAKAHRLLFLKVFGAGEEAAVLRLMIHIAAALALYYCCRNHIARMMRAQRLALIPKKRRKRPLDMEALSDFRLLRTTLIPIVLAFLFYSRTSSWGSKTLILAALLVVNGIVLYLPQYLPGSNRQSGDLSALDAFLFGVGGAAATLPGISCVGTTVSIAGVRGMDLKKAMNLALVMNIPMNIGFALFDLLELLGGGAGSLSFGALIRAVLAGITAFAGIFLGVRLLRKITENFGWSVFGLYSWGMALLTFILFLAAV